MFSQMRSKGSRFTLGVRGLRVCSLDAAFTVATVRNRSREVRIAVPMASFATAVTFGSFTRRVASSCVAGVALCDIPTCFITRQKSFCVAGARLLRRFQKMRSSFRGRRSTLATSIGVLRKWKAISTLNRQISHGPMILGRPKLRKAPQHPHAQRLGSNPWLGAFSPRIDLSKCEGGTKDVISLYHDYEFRVQPTNRWAVLACHWVLVQGLSQDKFFTKKLCLWSLVVAL